MDGMRPTLHEERNCAIHQPLVDTGRLSVDSTIRGRQFFVEVGESMVASLHYGLADDD